MNPVPLPRLPDGARLHPARLSVTLNLRPPSRATMLLPPGETLALRQLVELFTPQGSAGLFRVTAVDSVPGEGSEVTLRHVSANLADALIPGTGTLTGPARQVLSTLLSHQTAEPRWQLGDVDLPGELSCAYHSSNLLTALLSILDERPEYAYFFEGNVLHLRRLDDADACECRLSRNLTGAEVTIDDSDLCTRVYMSGLDAPIDADSRGVWGTVSRAITTARGLDAAARTEMARQYLQRHSEPSVTVRLDAIDLHAATGEALDSFPPGRICRVALPEYGAVIRERVVAVTYDDVYGNPEAAEVTLANRPDDTADIVSGLLANVNVCYRGLADANGLIRLEADRIELLAGEIDLKASSVVVTELATRTTAVEISLDGLRGEIALKASQEIVGVLGERLSQAEIDINGAKADILLRASREEVTALGTRLSRAEVDIDGARAAITLKASQSSLDALTGRVSTAEASLTVQANQISTKVSAGDIASSINQTAQAVKIQASKIELSGYVTASQFAAEFAGIRTQFSDYFSSREIEAGQIDASHVYGEDVVASHLAVDGADTQWKSATFVTGVTLPTFTGTTLNYLDHDGNKRSLWIPIRQTEGSVSRATYTYLGG